MHTYVTYAPDDARAPALDFVKWLGFRRARIMYRLARDPSITDEQWFNWAGFAGVQGAPAIRALLRWRGA